MDSINNHSKILVISGPTGSGESTITQELINKYPQFTRLVTATTRKPRNSEQNEKDYYFFTKEKFEYLIDSGEIIEYTYIKNRDVYYGSYKYDLDKKIREGYSIIVNPDIVGTRYYKKNYDAVTIFIMPGAISELRHRIKDRDGIDGDELEDRIINAIDEIETQREYYEYEVVNSDGKLDVAINNIIKILKDNKYVE